MVSIELWKARKFGFMVIVRSADASRIPCESTARIEKVEGRNFDAE